MGNTVQERDYTLYQQTRNYYDHPAAREEESKLYLNIHSTKPIKPKKYFLRSTIFPKDLCVIYGDERPEFGRFLLEKIGEAIDTPKMAIFYKVFCHFSGLDEETVEHFIQQSYEMKYPISFKQVTRILEEAQQSDFQNALHALYENTGDYYDRPTAIEENNRLYLDLNASKSSPKEINFKKLSRYTIYPKDIEYLYCHPAPLFARFILIRIRMELGLPMFSPVSIVDFCDLTGLDLTTVAYFIYYSR